MSAGIIGHACFQTRRVVPAVFETFTCSLGTGNAVQRNFQGFFRRLNSVRSRVCRFGAFFGLDVPGTIDSTLQREFRILCLAAESSDVFPCAHE